MKIFEIIDKTKVKAQQDHNFAAKVTWGAAVTGVVTGIMAACTIEIIKYLIR